MVEVVNFRRRFNQRRSERDPVLDPRPRYETRGRPDTEVATPAFEKRELPHPSSEASKELRFFTSRTSNATKLASQDPSTEFITFAFKGF